jgi:nitroimidazol reductase NimA-like FMN-containing flavoprotein (pyridoxamine 5'-phosphate oxidase superfamily)
VHAGAPVVIPTLYWREDDWLYLHGSAASRMLDEARRKMVCVTVTHIDGFVLTRSAFHHSVNYRSVVVLGRPEEVTDAAERAARMRIFMEGLFPGRWDTLRPGEAEGDQGNTAPAPAHRRSVRQDPLGTARGRRRRLYLAGLGRDHSGRGALRHAAAGRARERAAAQPAEAGEVPMNASITRASTTIGTPPAFTTASSN